MNLSITTTDQIEDVEVFTNLNRRDYARLVEDAAQIVSGSDSPTYYKAYDMTGGAGNYTLTLNVSKTGVYRITARYKVTGDSEWRWIGSKGFRDHIVVVSPKKALNLSMYELQVNTVEATSDDFNGRSTFEDLSSGDNDGFDKISVDYLRDIGINAVWLQPIHPIGSHNEPAPYKQEFTPGSPYAVKNFFAVNPILSNGNSRSSAMQAFKNFVSEADNKGLNIFFDVTFNHSAWDVEIGPAGNTLFGWTYPEDAQIRTIRPQWYSKYNSSLPEPDAFIYDTRANSTSEISVAPADRHDFGKWRDVIDFYFGTYSALGSPTNEQDAYWSHDSIVDEVVEYFAYYARYWLEQTGFNPNNPSESYKGIDGFRCDFAQGIPPAMWEYIINKTRSYKWDFIFMAESLDGGAVSRRAARQFDIINDNWVFATENLWTAPEWKQAVEQRRTDYGNALILRNTVTHDHQPPEDPW
ncbi:MAG TPA: alpha-amylase family glycosyl hydrolase, partial [bacterium]|nr:alpha-amylase family glycosyl hydrolase [bacterium]